MLKCCRSLELQLIRVLNNNLRNLHRVWLLYSESLQGLFESESLIRVRYSVSLFGLFYKAQGDIWWLEQFLSEGNSGDLYKNLYTTTDNYMWTYWLQQLVLFKSLWNIILKCSRLWAYKIYIFFILMTIWNSFRLLFLFEFPLYLQWLIFW